MQLRPLAIAGAYEVTPVLHGDARGLFLEWFRQDLFAEVTGRELDLQQANFSVSAAGVVRGIHYADVPPGQAKYVTCVSGAFFDVVVDLRVGSPTFGRWDAVLLDDADRRAVYLPEGLGHAVMSLQDGSTLAYLCSQPYAPQREHDVHPFDGRLGIDWPTTGRDGHPLTPALSRKDAAAPSLSEALKRGGLPSWEECLRYT